MHRSRTLFTAALAALGLAIVWTAGPSQAAGPRPSAQVDPSLLIAQPGTNLLGQADERLSLFLRLSGPSVVQLARAEKATSEQLGRSPLAASSLRAMHDVIEARQAPTIAAVEATGARVADSLQTVSNALLVHATRGQIRALSRIPGVVAIERAPILRPLLADAIPQIGADKVWADLGWKGEDTVVAVIDTGIDYTHADFGGPGTVEAYEAVDPEVADSKYFPTARVIGGYDLAGTYYSPGCNPGPGVICTREPTPDDNPIDSLENGGFPHGTHVAGIVAGQGVAATKVSPGVAPAAKLVALKVFGNPAGAPVSTDLAMSAVEWATEHNLDMDPPGTSFDEKIDVINMSLGSDFGGESGVDNETIDAAIEAGITVVASAGNDSNVPFITGSPAASEHALSVASIHADGDKGYWFVAKWDENGPQEISPDALPGTDWLPKPETVGRVEAPMAWYGLACNDANGNPSTPAQDVREKIALIARGTCPFYDKVKNAQSNGAVGAVIYSDTRPPTTMGCGTPSTCDQPMNIPALMIPQQSGLTIQEQLEAVNAVTGIMDPANSLDLADAVSGFSSRGPARFSTQIKPQISAPGDDIRSALAGSGTEGLSTGGTSMSGPMVAGVAALLWQRNRAESLELDPLDIAALAMNYSRQVVKTDVTRANPDGSPVSAVRQGAGLTNVFASATGNTVLRSADGIAELSFGFQATLDDQERIDEVITVRNLSDAAKTYKLSSAFLFPDDANKGVGIAFSPSEVTVAAGATEEVTVTAIITPNRLRAWDLRHFQFLINVAALETLEIDGAITFTEVNSSGSPVADGDVASMPFYILPRHQSCVAATPTGPFSLPATGDSFQQSWTNPCQVEAPVYPVPLVGSDPAESATDPNWPAKVDLQEIGATWGLVDPEDPTSALIMIFSLATGGAARIPYDTEFRVYMDYDQDGTYDEVIYNLYAPLLTADPAFARKFLVGHTSLASDGITPDYFSTSGTVFFQEFDVNDQVARFPVMAAELDGGSLDLSQGDVSFNFAASVSDFAEDYPVAGKFLGFDLAPNGAFDPKPVQFTYDQTLADCLTVVGPNSEDLGRLGERYFTVPGGATNVTPLRLQAVCEVPEGGVNLGVLMVNPTNLQGGPAGYNVRKGRLGAPATPPAILLPYLAMNHAFAPETSVTLAAVGEEGVSGTARLVQKGSSLEVTLNLPDAPTDAPHPAHIHIGSCESPGEVFKGLTPVENGTSVTMLADTMLADVAAGGHYVNVHKSDEAIAVTISCGNIPTAP